MNVFISANNTSQGKTYATLRLLKSFSEKGFKVAAMKPVETGVKNIPEDGKKLLELSQKLNPDLKNLTIDDIVPVQMELPAAPAVAGKTDFGKITDSYNKIKPLCDILLIEGAGGVLVPVTENFYMIDFVKFFNAKLFMVFGSRLGVINDFLLNMEYLNKKRINCTYALNLFDEDEYFSVTHPYLKQFSPMFLQKDLDKITEKILGE